MTKELEDVKKRLEICFEAGITPDFAENPDDADALKGLLKLFFILISTFRCVQIVFSRFLFCSDVFQSLGWKYPLRLSTMCKPASFKVKYNFKWCKKPLHSRKFKFHQ